MDQVGDAGGASGGSGRTSTARSSATHAHQQRSGVAAGSDQARNNALDALKAEGVTITDGVDGMNWAQ